MVWLYRWSVRASREETPSAPDSTEMVQDPNCETYIPVTEAVRAAVGGRDHYFCSEQCAEEYRNKHSAV